MDRIAKAPRPNRDAFVSEYAAHGNATRAAIAAGYKEINARRQATRLLSNVHIRERIRDEREAISRMARISVARTLREIDIIADSDIGDVMDFSGDEVRERAANTITKRARRTIRKCKINVKTTTRTTSEGEQIVTVERNVEYELWSKPDALEKLAKHQGLYMNADDLDAIRKRQDDLDARLPKRKDETTPSKN